MQQVLFRSILFISIALFLFSCAAVKTSTQIPGHISSLKFIDGYELPFNLKFKNTAVGGLSGIDYDTGHKLYYIISDDRNDSDHVRFYTAKIFFTESKLDTVVLVDVRDILQPGGTIYPNRATDRFKNPDPEAIRYNPVTHQLVWSSEGERNMKNGDTVLVNPAINFIRTDGSYAGSFTLPENLRTQAIEKGPRRNGSLEGISFADDYKTLFASVEEPLYEDGPRAGLTDNKAFIRIFKFDVAGKKSTAQYAYKLEPVAYPANPETAFLLNGVPDILSLGNNKLLVIERSFSTGRLACTIKIFIADLAQADDISGLMLKGNTSFRPATKKLLLNMDDLGFYTDNIEGVTFGPVLPNGHKSLLFIADNNFSASQKTQLLLFEVME